MTRVVWILITLTGLSGGWATTAAQSRTSCWLHWNGGYTSSNQAAPGQRVIYASGGIDYRCADGARVLADSAIVFEAQDRVSLFGSVSYLDPETELQADRAFYLSREGQLNAWENVVVRDLINGAVITGEELVLYRASEVRVMDRMTVRGGNPHARIRIIQGGRDDGVETPPGEDVADLVDGTGMIDEQEASAVSDSSATPEEVPTEAADTLVYDVDAERFILEGRRFFRAAGRVVVHRDSLEAFGDSLDFDQEARVMHLVDNARVVDPMFELSARTVSMLTGASGDEILAREKADLVADAVDLDAPSIRMFTQDGVLARLVAMRTVPELPGSDIDDELIGLSEGDRQRLSALRREPIPASGRSPTEQTEDEELSRPTAVAEDFTLWADSIDVLSPGQVLTQVIAVGRARGETVPDSVQGPVGIDAPLWRDWIEGDTIIADFQPPATDTAAAAGRGRGRLRQLTARGNGRSQYQMAPSDTTAAGPGSAKALHYVLADVIRIYFQDGEVSHMEVEGQVDGYHLEPRPRAVPGSVDTTSVVNDTTLVGTGGDAGRPSTWIRSAWSPTRTEAQQVALGAAIHRARTVTRRRGTR